MFSNGLIVKTVPLGSAEVNAKDVKLSRPRMATQRSRTYSSILPSAADAPDGIIVLGSAIVFPDPRSHPGAPYAGLTVRFRTKFEIDEFYIAPT